MNKVICIGAEVGIEGFVYFGIRGNKVVALSRYKDCFVLCDGSIVNKALLRHWK